MQENNNNTPGVKFKPYPGFDIAMEENLDPLKGLSMSPLITDKDSSRIEISNAESPGTWMFNNKIYRAMSIDKNGYPLDPTNSDEGTLAFFDSREKENLAIVVGEQTCMEIENVMMNIGNILDQYVAMFDKSHRASKKIEPFSMTKEFIDYPYDTVRNEIFRAIKYEFSEHQLHVLCEDILLQNFAFSAYSLMVGKLKIYLSTRYSTDPDLMFYINSFQQPMNYLYGTMYRSLAIVFCSIAPRIVDMRVHVPQIPIQDQKFKR